MKTIRLLWIEEETEDMLPDRLSCLIACNKYEVKIVDNICDATAEILYPEIEYDVFIIDIRIKDCDDFIPNEKYINRLGLQLIELIYETKQAKMPKVAIYTNERWTDINEIIETFGVTQKQFRQKREVKTNRQFKSFIEQFHA